MYLASDVGIRPDWTCKSRNLTMFYLLFSNFSHFSSCLAFFSSSFTLSVSSLFVTLMPAFTFVVQIYLVLDFPEHTDDPKVSLVSVSTCFPQTELFLCFLSAVFPLSHVCCIPLPRLFTHSSIWEGMNASCMFSMNSLSIGGGWEQGICPGLPSHCAKLLGFLVHLINEKDVGWCKFWYLICVSNLSWFYWSHFSKVCYIEPADGSDLCTG